MSSAPAYIVPRNLYTNGNGVIRRTMTEREFIDWCTEDTWAEWVGGEVVVMSPVSLNHATVTEFLRRLIGTYVDERDLGIVLSEPFQVRLSEQKSRRSPDIIFVSTRRQHLLRKLECNGAPDLVVETVSPSTQSTDRRDKFLEYEQAGVREYWIVDPESRTIEVYALQSNRKLKLTKPRDGIIRSKAIRGLHIDLRWLSRTRYPKVSTILREFARGKQ